MTSTPKSVAAYWNQLYKSGGTSGPGSIGKIRDWKWRIIRHYAGDPKEILDVGCGDLSFWDGRDCASYLGIDIAPEVLARDRLRRPSWTFIAVSAAVPLKVRRRVVFCFDLLFHVLNDNEYFAIVDNLCAYTGEWLFVFTWEKNPFEGLLPRFRIVLPSDASRIRRVGFAIAHPVKVLRALLAPVPSTDEVYQKYRPMNTSLDRFRSGGLTLVAVHPCPFAGATGALYVFQRPESRNSMLVG